MHRLAELFKDQVDFIYLNIDLTETREARNRFEITDRSQYTLIDADGNIIRKWYGYLNEDDLKAAIDEYLITS